MSIKCPFCKSENTKFYLKLKDYFLTREDFEIFECDDCKLLFTSPRPDASVIGKYYKSDYYLSHNEHKKGLIPWIYGQVKKVNIRYKYKIACDGYTNPHLLDFGCGVGDFLHFAQKKGCKITGCDMNENVRVTASKKLNVNIVPPEEIFTLPHSTFDIITMWHVLEHIDKLAYHAEQLHRLLKKNGRLVIAVPNYKSYDAEYYKDKWAAYDVPRHLNHFNKESLQNILSEKFNLEKIYPLKWDAYYISMMSENHLGNKNSFMKGVKVGRKSNKAAKTTGEYSSLIYVFQKL